MIPALTGYCYQVMSQIVYLPAQIGLDQSVVYLCQHHECLRKRRPCATVIQMALVEDSSTAPAVPDRPAIK